MLAIMDVNNKWSIKVMFQLTRNGLLEKSKHQSDFCATSFISLAEMYLAIKYQIILIALLPTQ